MNYNFENSIKLRVRYGETDQMGYCYYGNYAQFFEVGRVEALRKIGMSYKDMEDIGIMLPVSHYEVKYLSPAFYDDELTITTRIQSIEGARIFFEYSVKNEKNTLIAKASTTLVFVSKSNMRPITPPDTFISTLKEYEK